MASLEESLKAEGLSEYTAILKAQGMSSLADLAHVSEEDLKAIGIDKMFHRRKLLKLGGHTFTANSSIASEGGSSAKAEGKVEIVDESSAGDQSGNPSRKVGGDRVKVEVLGARGNNGTLSEKEFYVKGSLCTYSNKMVTPIGTGKKTVMSRGPFPVWGTETSSTMFEFETDFRSHCIAFELKEKRLIGDNKVIGVVIFPPKFFHRFTDTTVIDNWWPLRMQYEDEGEIHAYVRLRFRVPGGCPSGAQGRIFHVKGVSMSQRKLRVTIFEAKLTSKANPNQLYGEAMLAEKAENKPNLYVQLDIDNEERTSWRTATVAHSTTPAFDETFEFFMEVQTAKLITLRLKEEKKFGSDVTVGVIFVPIQFFLCQKEPTDVEEVHALHDEKDRAIQTGKLHIRLEIRNREGSEKRVSFRRTKSIKEEVKRESPSLEDDIGAVLVDDGHGDTTDDDAADL